MKTDFAEIIYVINATKDGQSEFWAAAPRVAKRLPKYSSYSHPGGQQHQWVGALVVLRLKN